ncbi:Cas6b C-terminal domain-containing protein [Desulfonema limicola]|uniref:Cas6b C-terminal domain-containing protein n=1 Tax=Desulfonema limicola TaxID=45656 RepID=A0A975GGZ5_9BACT|nr:CRISPR-associated endonuclease Cas6 [Desulfonema limicola]QTA80757.1 Cas6b C-terminal domain-containing protein [Desulfonema limicola]
MNTSKSIKQCIIQLIFDRSLNQSVKSHQLRGAIGSLYKDNILFHQHEPSGKPVYEYPLIQYKILEKEAFIIGLGKGAEVLAEKNLLEKMLYLGKEEYRVSRQQTSFFNSEIGSSIEHNVYKFITPWMGLNTSNYDKYQRSGNTFRKKIMLEKILTGNLLSMSKGLEYTVNRQIQNELLDFTEVQTSLKGNTMIAFNGVFAVNFKIPEYWGIGKSVSRGFGTIKNYYH